MILTARQNETLDELIYRQFGKTEGLVEIALEHNPALAYTPILTMGQRVEMPEKQTSYTPISTQTVQLWD